jgi:hypothetical protein
MASSPACLLAHPLAPVTSTRTSVSRDSARLLWARLQCCVSAGWLVQSRSLPAVPTHTCSMCIGLPHASRGGQWHVSADLHVGHAVQGTVKSNPYLLNASHARSVTSLLSKCNGVDASPRGLRCMYWEGLGVLHCSALPSFHTDTLLTYAHHSESLKGHSCSIFQALM